MRPIEWEIIIKIRTKPPPLPYKGQEKWGRPLQRKKRRIWREKHKTKHHNIYRIIMVIYTTTKQGYQLASY